jgi:hypothetical protein
MKEIALLTIMNTWHLSLCLSELVRVLTVLYYYEVGGGLRITGRDPGIVLHKP